MDRRALIFSLAPAVVGSFAIAGLSAVAAEPRLICRAFLGCATVSYDGDVALTALLEGVQGGVELFVPLTWGLRGFHVSVVGASGIETLPPINNFHPLPPQELNNRENFAHIYRGMLIGETLRQPAKDFFPQRGVFKIHVGYVSPVPKAYTSLVNAVVEEDGDFPATPISVVVT